MKPNTLFSIILSILLLSGFYTPAQALPDVLTITGVSPSTAVNNISTVLNITGTDFITGAVVSLNGYGALATTYVSAVSLTAVLPVGVPVGAYTVVVTLLDTTQASLSNALTVIAPPAPTIAPAPTAVEAPTATVIPSGTYERPLIVVLTYTTSSDKIAMGQDFDLYVTIYNSGQQYARNIVASFTPGEILPRKTGGVVSVTEIAPGNRADITQPLTAGTDLWGQATASLVMTLSYTDVEGVPYTETFNLSIPLSPPKVGAPTSTSTPTPTATTPAILRPQLVISQYTTSIDPLQPGVQFELKMQVQNVGNDLAKRVTMIVGGGQRFIGQPHPRTRWDLRRIRRVHKFCSHWLIQCPIARRSAGRSIHLHLPAVDRQYHHQPGCLSHAHLLHLSERKRRSDHRRAGHHLACLPGAECGDQLLPRARSIFCRSAWLAPPASGQPGSPERRAGKFKGKRTRS